ncbi:acyl-CoA synthetase [Sciscionella sediminilitoris]|uniref:acyl-CoA synthetase n=1 Tax=Sciscionella sediminilitoris TaxID=1445613 RepID=UPI0004DF42AE|nr:acyl-CoA synthetase [Sciscionella sp. SE31]
METANAGLWNIASATPDAEAVIEADGRTTSYGELTETANAYALGLAELGFEVGDVVVVMLPNDMRALALYFAAVQSGYYIVMANWHLTGPEVEYILRDSEAKAFIAHERFAETAQAAADGAGITARYAVGEVPGFAPLDSLGGGRTTRRPEPRTAGSPMLYTSGTTGNPKGVRRPLTGADPDAVPVASSGFFALFGIQPFDDHVHLCGSPLYHTAVLNFASISLQLGHPVVLMDRWDPERMLALIEAHRVTHSHMVPTQFHRLLALPKEVRDRYDVSSLRAMIHGAAPCPDETKRAMLDWWGPVVIEYYAATEGGGTLITSPEWLRKPGSVGKAWPYSEVAIFDEEGNRLAAGETGTVYLKMGGSSFKYHNAPDKTEKARIGEMFTMGDIGYLDEDGYLFLLDRKNNMIISGGVNIYPAEIENALMGHPEVADVAVFGIPNPDWGEEVKAVVQPAGESGDRERLAEDLLAYAAGRLAKFKLPRSIDFLAELPRDPNGKLYKRKLSEPYWEDAAKA